MRDWVSFGKVLFSFGRSTFYRIEGFSKYLLGKEIVEKFMNGKVKVLLKKNTVLKNKNIILPFERYLNFIF